MFVELVGLEGDPVLVAVDQIKMVHVGAVTTGESAKPQMVMLIDFKDGKRHFVKPEPWRLGNVITVPSDEFIKAWAQAGEKIRKKADSMSGKLVLPPPMDPGSNGKFRIAE
jgi:hypothetical protein